MKPWILPAVLALGIGLITGCEWSSGGGAEDFNDRWNFVNFSGVYRGNPLVSDFSAVPGAEVAVNGERVGTVGTGQTTVSGSTAHQGLQPGSLTITAGSFTFIDPAGNGTFTGIPQGSGSIVYGTGAFTINFGGASPDPGTAVLASYVYSVSGSNAGAGSSGGTINTFTVLQEGNRLNIQDNLGSVYAGSFGSIRSSTGGDQDDGTFIGDDVIAQFSVSGDNAAGYRATIAGVFTGVVDVNSLSQRIIEGTYVEENGVTGNVFGRAPTIAIPAIEVPAVEGTDTGTNP